MSKDNPNRIELTTAAQKAILEKAQYWLDLAAELNYRGEHYRELCCYKMAAGYFFELRDKKQLRQIFKKRPDVKGLLSAEIVEFTESEEKMEETQFLLLKKLIELCASQELRIIDLEKRLTGSALDKTETVEELKKLIKELPGVHFPNLSCDWENEKTNSLQRGTPLPVPFPENDYF